jgi:Fe-S-cluster containining protein
MELSSDDIKTLKDINYRLEEFAVFDGGVARLRNVNGHCYFYIPSNRKCRIYPKRPLGCYIYPVVYLENEGAIVDEFCQMGHTISEKELRTKEKTLNKLLKKIDSENVR